MRATTQILPARPARTDPQGAYAVCDQRHGGRERLVARFADLHEANAYAKALRDAGAIVKIRVIPTGGLPDAA